jgi:hypothetical protein
MEGRGDLPQWALQNSHYNHLVLRGAETELQCWMEPLPTQ